MSIITDEPDHVRPDIAALAAAQDTAAARLRTASPAGDTAAGDHLTSTTGDPLADLLPVVAEMADTARVIGATIEALTAPRSNRTDRI
ncbi:hypothetical protein [Nocardia paucivorans]|uniref:hypothetical protein n=1 Tax=Nocardia paucivorans TaxID=114259 RepID=UPI000313861E|nr:hypothetical protein [Nocardia paucivorans]